MKPSWTEKSLKKMVVLKWAELAPYSLKDRLTPPASTDPTDSR